MSCADPRVRRRICFPSGSLHDAVRAEPWCLTKICQILQVCVGGTATSCSVACCCSRLARSLALWRATALGLSGAVPVGNPTISSRRSPSQPTCPLLHHAAPTSPESRFAVAPVQAAAGPSPPATAGAAAASVARVSRYRFSLFFLEHESYSKYIQSQREKKKIHCAPRPRPSQLGTKCVVERANSQKLSDNCIHLNTYTA